MPLGELKQLLLLFHNYVHQLLYFWISAAHQSLALVLLGPGLYLEPLVGELEWTAGVGLDEEAQCVEGHLQLRGGAHKHRPHRLVVTQPHKAHLDDCPLEIEDDEIHIFMDWAPIMTAFQGHRRLIGFS